MKKKKKLPIGIDNFEKIRKDDFYYVDKTKLIEQLLDKWGEANLFTRPRGFGKSLNMSMFKHFFEIGTDKTLFDGLYIADNKELCETYMGKISRGCNQFERHQCKLLRRGKKTVGETNQ